MQTDIAKESASALLGINDRKGMLAISIEAGSSPESLKRICRFLIKAFSSLILLAKTALSVIGSLIFASKIFKAFGKCVNLYLPIRNEFKGCKLDELKEASKKASCPSIDSASSIYRSITSVITTKSGKKAFVSAIFNPKSPELELKVDNKVIRAVYGIDKKDEDLKLKLVTVFDTCSKSREKMYSGLDKQAFLWSISSKDFDILSKGEVGLNGGAALVELTNAFNALKPKEEHVNPELIFGRPFKLICDY